MSCHVLRCAGVLRASALAGVLAAAVAGCSRGQNSAQDGAEQAAPRFPSSAETSLSLKRGMITLEGQQGTFRPCGSTTDLWVIDQSDGSFREVASIAEPNDALYVEARGERTALPADMPAAGGYSGAFVMEQILYAGAPTPTGGCDAPAPGFIVRARGNEPSWAIEVTGEKMEWTQDKGEAITIDSPREADTEGAVSYEGRNSQHDLQLIIDAQPCRDPTTEEYFAYSARAQLDGMEFKGCARVGR